MREDLPTGTVTFLFTDVEGSTRLLHELGAKAYAEALAEHRRVIREACAGEGGVEVDTEGDAFFFAFPTAPGAVAAASTLINALASGPIQVRVGLHTGTPLLTDEGYVGPDVHRAARIGAAGHGGQVLVSTSTASLVTFTLHDVGEHRLKDLSAPERLYQVGDAVFPPLATLYRTNLPVPVTPFLGRERELDEVTELLTGDDARLLTLTGPGGTGKTRLALQAAAEASESFPDGVFWVPLAALRDPELVLPSLARTLAVGEEPDTPLEDTLVAHLAGKRLLLLLDNVEHLLPAAAERIAALRAPSCSLLVTSRERLRIGGEQTWPVPPLEVEDGSALFRARARAVDPSFIPTPAVDELCARLDELPLAIELGAARTAVFSPEQLLERLSQRLDLLKGDRDAVPRQQTLRATIEWSHDLLTTEEQRLFARLAIFVGGCTYEAAEEVAGADPETLQSLLDKSLVRKRVAGDAPRYWMLETIREYAGEHLDASGESDALRRRHAEHFLALAEEAEPHVEHVPGVWIERLEADTDNLRAALDQLEAAGESERALRLAGSLAGFWEAGYLAEGLNRLERVLSLDERPTAGRAKALAGAARVARMSGDSPTTMLRAEEARALYVELGDSLGTAHSGVLLGLAAADEGDFSQALQLFDESARLFREAGDEEEALFPVRLLGWVYEELGDYERARAVHEVNLGRARALGNKQMEGQSLGALANLALHDGRARDGVSILQGVLRIDRDRGIRLQTTLDLTRFARALAFAGGAAAEATQLLSCAAARREEIGAGTPPAYVVAMNEEAIAAIREELDDRAFTEAWEQGRALTLDQAVELAVDYVE